MNEEATPTRTLEQHILDIVMAYRSARAAGQPYDLDAVLAGDPAVADAVRAHLADDAANPPPNNPTLSFVAARPASTPSPESATVSFGPRGGPAAPPHLGDFGDYEILEEIARGGMGVVFRAREKSLNRIVALKMILSGHLATPHEVRRFRLEAEEASHLDHPNIVPIYHIGEYGGQHYYTMKLIEEGPVGAELHGPRADLRKVVRLVACVAHAVHHAHRHGILHRDIKPGNILIDKEGRPHVTDFGLAKHLSGPPGQTQSGAILGTPQYISPEQAAARKDLTTATDIYSVGAVLYDLIAGRPPFQASSTVETLVKVLEEEPVPPHRLNPAVDRDLETICLTCLHKDPRRRYASAEALARDLERYLAGESIQARRIGQLARAGKWVRRRPLAAALVGVLFLALLALAFGGWIFSVRLQAAVHQAQEAQAIAEKGQREADLKRQQVNDYLVYLNERLANLKVEQPIRLEFLHEGLALCEQFCQDGGGDAEARRQTALLYRCLGELEQEREDSQRATAAYGRALELLQQLDREAPGVALYRNDLSGVYAKQAHLLETTGQHEAALVTLQQAIDVQDRLAAEPSAPLAYQQRAAELRQTLGSFLEEQKKPAEAAAAYRAALERQEKLLDGKAPASVRLQLAGTAGFLAWLLADTRPAEAESLLQRRLREMRAGRAAEADNRDFTRGLWDGYTDLAAFYKQHGRHAELAALANQVRGDFLSEQEPTYQAACFLVGAVRVVARQRDLPAPERDALTEEYAAAAVALLDKAIKEGFANRARVEVDPNLDPLRQRKDFGALITDLERRFPGLSAEEELGTLQALFDSARKVYRYQMAGARTQAERQRARAVKPDMQAYAEKYLALAQKRRDSGAALEALVRVLETCQVDEMGSAAVALRQKAAQLLQQDHFAKPEFRTVCIRFARTPVPEAERLLEKAFKEHPSPEVRGLAGLTLATNLARAGNQIHESDPRRAEAMTRQAEQRLERLVEDYGGVQVGRSTLKEVARHELDEVRYLSVGSLARDIAGEDLNGRPLKLSGLKGKVVVLDFWADWCGFCRQMYPHEQDLVQRYRGRPFELLGINCDDDRDAMCHTVARKGLTWRSWWDGGPDGGRLRQAWHVNSFPSVWVLDHKGVIRFKDVRGKELDDAVAQLVKEAEQEQARAK